MSNTGIQKGTQSFAKATAMEAINFGARLAVKTQVLLEHADEILSFESESSGNNNNNRVTVRKESMEDFTEEESEEDNNQDVISKFANQPSDLNEGILEIIFILFVL